VSLGGHLTTILRGILHRHPERVTNLPNASTPVPGDQENLIKQITAPLKFLFVGRFVSNKGIPLLLEAVKQLSAEGLTDNLELHLIGKGPLFARMKTEYALPSVNFLGFVADEDLQQHYLDKDVFILPTLFEGMPTVIIEAMACGMPIVVTDTGATTDLVDATNGMIIEKNNVPAIKSAILQYLGMDKNALKQQSEASLKKFHDRFSWKKVAEGHMRVFEEVLSEAGSKNEGDVGRSGTEPLR
jgi:glycosyltransferase involved in cell wall biosynthesis